MVKVDIDKWREVLEELEDGDLNETGAEYLKDLNLDLAEYLHDGGLEDGLMYGTLVTIVTPEKPFPELYKEFEYASGLDGEKSKVKIKEISKVRWHSKKPGVAIVTMLVQRVQN